MISLERLKEYARLRSYNLGQAEKDYYQEIILFILYREFGRELVFKGGTALTKCYGFDRFSEDLDFNLASPKDIKKIISSGLDSFYIVHEISEERFKDSFSIICRLHGPLFNGSRTSLCKISLDISLREKTEFEPVVRRIGLNIEDIQSFDVIVMDQREILAEKIRAIFTRDKARDLYDTYYLFEKGIAVSTDLINKKLSIYNLKYSNKILRKRVADKENIWNREMKNIASTYPEFRKVKQTIAKKSP